MPGTNLKENSKPLKKKISENKYLLIGVVAICTVIGLIYFLNLDPAYDDENFSFTYPKGYIIDKSTNSDEVKLYNPSSSYSSGYSIFVLKIPNSEVSLQEWIEVIRYGLKNGYYKERLSNLEQISIDETTGYQFDSVSTVEHGEISTQVFMEKNGNLYSITLSRKMDSTFHKTSFSKTKTDFENTVIKTFHAK